MSHSLFLFPVLHLARHLCRYPHGSLGQLCVSSCSASSGAVRGASAHGPLHFIKIIYPFCSLSTPYALSCPVLPSVQLPGLPGTPDPGPGCPTSLLRPNSFCSLPSLTDFLPPPPPGFILTTALWVSVSIAPSASSVCHRNFIYCKIDIITILKDV